MLAQKKPIQLPELGDRSSSIVSPLQEYQLGQSWLHAYYNHVDIERDYLLLEYLEDVTRRLARYSDLSNRSVHVLLVDNPGLNAFAVPGGIIGIHSGLLLYAETEHELSSVIGHELAHLSQRHFARSVEAQRGSSIKALAGLLAGIALAATVGGDAGIAAISLSQGLALNEQLSYSRLHEKEADRLGLQTLIRANMNPRAMADMFGHMLKLSHFVGFKPSEYLLTHPLPESRIADAELRVNQFPQRYYAHNDYYDLMRVHAQIKAARLPQDARRRFSAELEQTPNSVADKYGLAKSYLLTRDVEKARQLTDELLAIDKDHRAFRLLNLQTTNAEKDYAKSINLAQNYLRSEPNSYALGMVYAETLKLNNQFDESLKQLERLAEYRSKEPAIWYDLAETYGLKGDIYSLHRARAEYFVLRGYYNQAVRHMQSARNMVTDDYIERSVIDERISDILALQNSQQFR